VNEQQQQQRQQQQQQPSSQSSDSHPRQSPDQQQSIEADQQQSIAQHCQPPFEAQLYDPTELFDIAPDSDGTASEPDQLDDAYWEAQHHANAALESPSFAPKRPASPHSELSPVKRKRPG
jgi:hypothetical protein